MTQRPIVHWLALCAVIFRPLGVTATPAATANLDELRRSLGGTRFRVLLLSVGHKLTQKRIGQRLGISQPAVHKHLAKACERYPQLEQLIGGGRTRPSNVAGEVDQVQPANVHTLN
jgi:predicted DNA-binding protein (UPF0251 family)